MRLITIPETVELKRTDGHMSPTPFLEWLEQVVEGAKELGQGLRNVRRSQKILDRIEHAKTTKAAMLSLEDADWETLRKSAEDMTWSPTQARRFVTYLVALIEEAQEEKGPAK